MTVTARETWDADDERIRHDGLMLARTRLLAELPGDDPDYQAILGNDEATIRRRVEADGLAAALDQTLDFLARYVVFASPEQAHAVALWCGYTWYYDQWDTAPYLAVQAPARRSGKTRLLECAELMVRAALLAGGTSPAALVRVVNQDHPTLLVDEADPLFGKRGDPGNEDLRGLFNNGYRRGKVYLKVVGEGKKLRVDRFDPFGPKALASIGRLPDTIQDRSIIIELKRRIRSEPITRFRFNRATQEAAPIRARWQALADQELPEQVTVPEQLTDREEDCWEPLLALAEAAGGQWPARGRRAALALTGQVEVEDESKSVMVLSDIRGILTESQGVIRIATTELLDKLHTIEERPWADDYRHGKPLKAEGLAYLLRPYKLRARQMRIGGAVTRGYETDSFQEAFARYLSPAPESPLTRDPVTFERESEHERNEVTGNTPSESAEAEVSNGLLDGPPEPRFPERVDEIQAALGRPPREQNGKPPTTWCDDFSSHQSSHRQIATGVWWCDRCQIPQEVTQ